MSAPFSPLKRFAIATGLGSVTSLSFFLTSMYATHTPFREMGIAQIGVAIALPLICGVLAAMKGDRFLDLLANVLNNTQL